MRIKKFYTIVCRMDSVTEVAKQDGVGAQTMTTEL
jgi:hypothetical protein